MNITDSSIMCIFFLSIIQILRIFNRFYNKIKEYFLLIETPEDDLIFSLIINIGGHFF